MIFGWETTTMKVIGRSEKGSGASRIGREAGAVAVFLVVVVVVVVVVGRRSLGRAGGERGRWYIGGRRSESRGVEERRARTGGRMERVEEKERK